MHSHTFCLSLKVSGRGSGPALLLFTCISQTSQGFLLCPSLVALSKMYFVWER